MESCEVVQWYRSSNCDNNALIFVYSIAIPEDISHEAHSWRQDEAKPPCSSLDQNAHRQYHQVCFWEYVEIDVSYIGINQVQCEEKTLETHKARSLNDAPCLVVVILLTLFH